MQRLLIPLNGTLILSNYVVAYCLSDPVTRSFKSKHFWCFYLQLEVSESCLGPLGHLNCDIWYLWIVIFDACELLHVGRNVWVVLYICRYISSIRLDQFCRLIVLFNCAGTSTIFITLILRLPLQNRVHNVLWSIWRFVWVILLHLKDMEV